jgi:vancomycin resistance protein YoaR
MTQRSLHPRPAVAAPGWLGTAVNALREGVMPSRAERGIGPGGILAPLARLLPRLLLIIAVALLIGTLAIFAFRATFADRVFPAVVVGDVQVGGMTVDQAAGAVRQRAAALETGTITFSLNGRTWSPTLAEIGASVDVDTSVDAAYALGRDDNAVARLGFASSLLRGDQVVPLRFTVDRAALNRWFDAVDADIGHRAVDASIAVDGTAVTIRADATGTVVDREAATALILGSLAGLDPADVALPTMLEQPMVRVGDLQGPATALQRALSAPVLVTFEGQKWDLAPADLARFVTIDIDTSGALPEVRMALDREALAAWLRETLGGEVNRAPVDARIAWDHDAGLVARDPSQSGAAIRPSALAEAVEASFFDRQGPVEVPVVVTAPKIDSNNLGALNINTLLSRGDSNYGGQRWYRDTNVELAAQYLNGALVAPGDEFSFNAAIGDITKDRGYVESGVIVNGRATTGDGGGVCQVSTTMFRATILAGLPITDWAEHTQRLKIYEQDGWTAGYDASILQIEGAPRSEWGDFKFRNDTGGYVLVQSWTEYPYHIVEIYGNDDGREVEVSDANIWEATSYPPDIEVVDDSLPPGSMSQTEWPRMPADAAFVMTVTYADGTVNQQEFYSEYRGSGNVWTVSPDMAGQSPGA